MRHWPTSPRGSGSQPRSSAAFPQVDRLFAHQVQAITRISAGLGTLVATGTGSGKTEAFLVPVVAHAFQQRHRPGVKAIALYPMNALVNDQEDRVRTACERARAAVRRLHRRYPRSTSGPGCRRTRPTSC